MASGEREFEEQLEEAGNRLLQPPSSVDELLPLLDQIENFLSRVEQSPLKSMQPALSPFMKALVADKLLRHPDVDVKVAVASCISEITRITAPDAPYDDDQMKVTVLSLETVHDHEMFFRVGLVWYIGVEVTFTFCKCNTLFLQIENFLSRVEQSPLKSMQTALSPFMKALVADKLLRHPDVDVKVAVASCISEITRITAPDAPYDDDQMKDVFQLIVSSFENLSDKSSRSYNKRTLILETVTKVRSCVVMLDLECDGLIVKMFHHFLKAIRDYHPENVFSSMVTIMSLELEESEDISRFCQLLGNWGRVFENCAIKVKPYLIQAKESLGHSFDDYSKVIASICDGTTDIGHNNDGTVRHNDDDACGEQLIEESKLDSASSEGAAQADENKLAVASPDGAAQACPDSLYYFYDQMTKESVTETCPEGDHPAVDRSPKSVMRNGVPETGNEDRLADPESLKKLEHARQADQLVDTNVTSSAEPDDSDSGKIVKAESKPEQTSKKRGQKPNSLINPTEPSDSSRVDSDKEAERTADRRKSRSKEVRSSPSEELSVEVAVLSENDKENVQLSSPKAIESEPVNVASPSPSGSVPDEGSPMKVGRPKKKDLVEEVPLSANVASNKTSAGTSDLEKTQRHSGKKAPAGSTEEKTGSDGQYCVRKEAVSSPKGALRLDKDEVHLEETTKTNSKRKRTPGKERASDAIEYDSNLIGKKVKVWWPDDDILSAPRLIPVDQSYRPLVGTPFKARANALYGLASRSLLQLVSTEIETWKELTPRTQVMPLGQPLEVSAYLQFLFLYFLLLFVSLFFSGSTSLLSFLLLIWMFQYYNLDALCHNAPLSSRFL
ncbi:hypothetical protein TEA_021150 [Camellia sinensis var. sinensis]|uniref:Uncharacterized protein n=1 Tax=Camellia sinensis var. sinensis TaxID=542762 RepID=A0A4S4DGE5_CAMSN|nr:hypothetical protein TEA_021150 [Camellia sinensis var. sinensis]